MKEIVKETEKLMDKIIQLDFEILESNLPFRMLNVSSISLLSSVFCLQAIFRQRWSKFSANVWPLGDVAD